MLGMSEKDHLGGVVGEEKEVFVGKFDPKCYMFLESVCYKITYFINLMINV